MKKYMILFAAASVLSASAAVTVQDTLAKVPVAPAPGTKVISVLDFGAKGDGVTDDTAAFQRALDAARGLDGIKKKDGTIEECGKGRSVFSLYVPSQKNGFYKITDTLVVDGTSGMTIYGDGAFTNRGNKGRSDHPSGTIRWAGKGGKPVIQILGATDIRSNPNFMITIRDLSISGHATSTVRSDRPFPKDEIALSAIHFGPTTDNPKENCLTRNALISNVTVDNCRFGVYGNNIYGKNTDNATVTMFGCLVKGNAQAGLFWGTGNAIVNVISCHFTGNGATPYPKDVYASPIGANIHIIGGYLDVVSYTSAGRPTHADIYQSAGRVAVTNAWSDTQKYFLYQGYVSQNKGAFHNTMLTGIRHYAANKSFIENTPDSLRIICPGTVVTGCLLYGNIRVDSGYSGRPVFAGINFIRKDAGFIGTGVEKQRSAVLLGSAGNHGQITLGGTNKGEKLAGKGDPVPAYVVRGDNPAVFQVLGGSAASTGMTLYSRTDDANGTNSLLINAYRNGSKIVPLQADKMIWQIFTGGHLGLKVTGYHPRGKKDPVSPAVFKDFGGWVAAAIASHREEVVFMPPKRTAPPSFSSGNFWRGGMYFDTKENKMKVNVGGGTWVPMH